MRGWYLTAINIHNPTKETVEYRFKTALAGLGVDGAISSFTYGSTGPDGAQVFACGSHIKIDLATTAPVDGFFVIESRLPLDVTAVYTSADNAFIPKSLSFHVNKIDARAIPNLCQKDLDIDISSPAMWKRPSGALINQVPAANVSALGWDAARTWMSYSPSRQCSTRSKLCLSAEFLFLFISRRDLEWRCQERRRVHRSFESPGYWPITNFRRPQQHGAASGHEPEFSGRRERLDRCHRSKSHQSDGHLIYRRSQSELRPRRPLPIVPGASRLHEP